ncbi:hypothetical protein R3P38DRAFT_2828129 [Favolaschia claudopus]|uniref:3-beta hydroxysteroid dehydrogenase/isomerase domain-containing protein n=1 Tax=Favolaschia claudopus TaxID=2862362 RepID=A0AAW0E9T8_9AGAR
MNSVLVIGGSGFLGSHVVEQLVNDGGYSVTVFDIRQLSESDDGYCSGVRYLQGSIVDSSSIEEAVKTSKPDAVLHTASPVHGLPEKIYYDVNVEGTRNVISACRAAGVKNLVYTSSTGAVWTGQDFHGVSEDRIGLPVKGYDAYHHTKAVGERLVLSAQQDGMNTVILRPCGMTGYRFFSRVEGQWATQDVRRPSERDKQLIWRMAEVHENKQHTVQIGDNTNLIDYAYAGNVAHAHVLACAKLLTQPNTVSGQSFFITNGEPMPPWDFSRMIWKELGDDGKGRITVIPRFLGLILAILAEIWCRITGSSTQFNRFSVRFITGTQWYNIDKARKLLGYKPTVTLGQAVERTVKWWKTTGAAQHALQKH